MRPEPKPRDPKHLVVTLPMADIEAILDRHYLRDPKLLPHLFAELAWKAVGGSGPCLLRATGNIDSALDVDCLHAEPTPLVLAYVAIPQVVFAGWAVPAEVAHPGRVTPGELFDVRELLRGRWQNHLAEPVLHPPGSFLEYLERVAS